MAKKNEEKQEEKVIEKQAPTPLAPVSITPPAPAKDKMIRVRNAGKPFPCDLTMYGYGMRWPTNAVYAIPFSKYTELLSSGFDGAVA